MKGEKIYTVELDITNVIDSGMPLEAIISGTGQVPPQGVRIDVAFEGYATGRLTGPLRGVDYIQVRADGRIDLDIRAMIETHDGHRIALSADGVAVPRAAEPVADLSVNHYLSTASADYAWVNKRQIWACGTVNFFTGKIHVDAYLQ